MKIVVEKTSGRVAYAGDVQLTAEGVIGAGFVDRNATTATCDELEVASPPYGFRAGAWAYDSVTEQWTLLDSDVLDSLKAEKVARINAKRDAMEQEGFAYAGHTYQSDPISTQRIANAALAATSALLTSQPFAVAWQTADNGVVELDANGMLAMQAALMQRAAALHYHARDLKAAINAAADLAALELIDTEAGWPPL